MKSDIAIPKSKLKFIVEVSKTGTEVKVSATRYIEVAHKEDMGTNAQLAKYDGIRVHDKYYNCNELVRGVLGYLETCLEIDNPEEGPKHFVLKRQSRAFGK